MNILFLNLTESPREGGGGEVVLWEQITGFRSRGHRCALLVAGPGRSLERQCERGITVWKAGLRNIYWPSPGRRRNSLARLLWHVMDSYNPLMAHYLPEVLERENPDVVSIHNQAGWSAAVYRALHKAHVPVVQVLHGHYLLCPKTIMYRNGKNCSRQCRTCKVLRLPHKCVSNEVASVVGVSDYILKRHLEAGLFDAVSRRHVIYNAASLTVANATFSSRRGRPLRLGYMGRLDPAKGIECVLDVVRRFDPEDVELWVAGDCASAYARGLRDSNSVQNVTFKGYISPADFYPHVDCVVVPSLMNDTLPGVVYEGFCYGRAVLGARRGGIPEMIAEGTNGYLFEPTEPGSLYDVVARLKADRCLLESLCIGAARSGARYVDIEGWIEHYREVYEEAAGARNRMTANVSR